MKIFRVLPLWATFCFLIVLMPGFNTPAHSQDYTFTTVAGLAGMSGSSDGTNSDARFYFPAGLTVDGAGNLFVSEILNHTIRKISFVGTNAVVSTIAGLAGISGPADGTNSDARFDHPNDIALDSSGAVFVADHYNQTIRKVTPLGTNWVVTTIAGSVYVRDHSDGTNGDAHFYSPTGVAVDSAGRLFITDTANFTIREAVLMGTNWVVSTAAGLALDYGFQDGANDSALFDYPYGITVNSQGVLYVADWGNHAIREVKASGPDWVVNTIAGLSGTIGSADGTGTKAKFNFPNGIAADPEGFLYVTDQSNDTIRRLTPPASAGGNWSVSTIGGLVLQSGSADGSGSNARFYRPWGIALDRAGNLFAADYLNHTIRKGVPPWGPIPSLQILLANHRAVITWPASATNFVLETSLTLTANASWTALTNGVTTNLDRLVWTNNSTAQAAFYRLHKR
jgi:sugar lactone lactonase YvrE